VSQAGHVGVSARSTIARGPRSEDRVELAELPSLSETRDRSWKPDLKHLAVPLVGQPLAVRPLRVDRRPGSVSLVARASRSSASSEFSRDVGELPVLLPAVFAAAATTVGPAAVLPCCWRSAPTRRAAMPSSVLVQGSAYVHRRPRAKVRTPYARYCLVLRRDSGITTTSRTGRRTAITVRGDDPLLNPASVTARMA